MQQVYEKYIKKHPSSEWRYELRVRYFPSSLQDLCERDNVTFYFYYDQVSGALVNGDTVNFPEVLVRVLFLSVSGSSGPADGV